MVPVEVRSANGSTWHSLMRFARAIDLFIKPATVAIGSRQRDDDEARVGLALRPFRLGDDAPLPAPALAGRPGQFLEPARRLTGCLTFLARLGQLDTNGLGETGIAGLSGLEVVVEDLPVLRF